MGQLLLSTGREIQQRARSDRRLEFLVWLFRERTLLLSMR